MLFYLNVNGEFAGTFSMKKLKRYCLELVTILLRFKKNISFNTYKAKVLREKQEFSKESKFERNWILILTN